MSALQAIAPYVRRRGPGASPRCELCGTAIGEPHGHLVDRSERSLRCACRACALLFQRPGLRYRAAPDRWLHDPGFALDAASWAALQIPVRLAFFFRQSAGAATPGGSERWVAFYPGPAGATESQLPLDWQALAAGCPLAAALEPDVEALLVSGEGRSGELACFLVPIHACYELVGRVKRSWRGFDGGEQAWAEIDAFFAAVRARATPLAGSP